MFYYQQKSGSRKDDDDGKRKIREETPAKKIKEFKKELVLVSIESQLKTHLNKAVRTQTKFLDGTLSKLCNFYLKVQILFRLLKFQQTQKHQQTKNKNEKKKKKKK